MAPFATTLFSEMVWVRVPEHCYTIAVAGMPVLSVEMDDQRSRAMTPSYVLRFFRITVTTGKRANPNANCHDLES